MVIFILTLMIEAGITYYFADKFSIRFIEIMFFAGLAFSVISFGFSSSGGTVTRYIDSQISAQTGIIQKPQGFIFRRNPIFYGSFTYMLIGLLFLILLIVGVIPPVTK
ncbi:hypothetical protein [Neobacillus sp. D3-1R]|uniref:hypothetical protein n=1 Tax=Neobacillus sp. D3-1R TaxID=3445778 RepID=UPI003FA0ED00